MYGVQCLMYANKIILPLLFNRNPCLMNSEEMKRRTKLFAINIAFLTQKIPDTLINKAYKGQITGHQEGQTQMLILLISLKL